MLHVEAATGDAQGSIENCKNDGEDTVHYPDFDVEETIDNEDRIR